MKSTDAGDPIASSWLSFLIEIELEGGEVIHLRGQGAGRWPTAVSVLGDLHEVARLLLESGILLNT
jgi:homoserine dehydrogenase